MNWLIITIFAYFLLAIVALVDKYLLSGRFLSPKIYAFYVGILGGVLTLILIPFGFFVPELAIIILALLAGVFHILGIFFFFKAIRDFEVSRIVPAIGGILSLFVFVLVFLSPVEKEPISFYAVIAFFLLVLGSIIITYEKPSPTISSKFFPRGKIFTKEWRGAFRGLKIAFLTAFLLAISVLLTKFVYLSTPFIAGFIWTRVGAFLVVMVFLFFSQEIREEIFKRRETFNIKTWRIMIPNQIMGSSAFLLQNWAISLVPLSFLAFISALEGIRYVFILIFTILFSLIQPLWVKGAGLLKEEISREIFLQKIIAILLISGGLVLLVL